jgi:hypothetical protein
VESHTCGSCSIFYLLNIYCTVYKKSDEASSTKMYQRTAPKLTLNGPRCSLRCSFESRRITATHMIMVCYGMGRLEHDNGMGWAGLSTVSVIQQYKRVDSIQLQLFQYVRTVVLKAVAVYAVAVIRTWLISNTADFSSQFRRGPGDL